MATPVIAPQFYRSSTCCGVDDGRPAGRRQARRRRRRSPFATGAASTCYGSPMAVRPCVLIILDGWGIAPSGPGNAIALADTPHLDRYWAEGQHSVLAASGLAVGLPEGQIGNSEVGHLNLGAGFRVLQELPRIDEAILSGELFENPALCAAVDAARDRGTTLHLMGLFSNGGVHSHARHLYALLDLAARRGL